MKPSRAEAQSSNEKESREPTSPAVQEILDQNARVFRTFVICGLVVAGLVLVSMVVLVCF